MLGLRLVLLYTSLVISIAVGAAATDTSRASTSEQTRSYESYIAAQDEFSAHELAYFKHELDSLKSLVRKLESRLQQVESQDSLVADLAAGVDSLRAENRFLSRCLLARASSSPQFGDWSFESMWYSHSDTRLPAGLRPARCFTLDY